MPWYIILVIIAAQAMLIVYMRNHHETTVGILNNEISTLQDSNNRLVSAVNTCEVVKSDTIKLTQDVLKDTIDIEREKHRIEKELCVSGWGEKLQSGKIGEDNDTIKPDDVFDSTINRLLQEAYDCATNRICVRSNP